MGGFQLRGSSVPGESRPSLLSERLEEAINHLSLGSSSVNEKGEVVFPATDRLRGDLRALGPDQVKPGTPDQCTDRPPAEPRPESGRDTR